MSNISFQDDPFSRRVIRLFLVLQVAAMGIVLCLSLIDLSFLALVISFLTFVLFIVVLVWLYTRYQGLPIVREKRDLEHLLSKFQKNILVEGKTIQSAVKERSRLFQLEKEEIHTAIRALQRSYIEDGLASASINDAAIPGVGPKLKERLAGNGIQNAAHVSNTMSEIPGFGEAKRQVLLGWRSSVLAKLESTKPAILPQEQMETIQQKYRAEHDKNNAAERKAIASKQLLEHELTSLRPRLKQLAPITFTNYLSKSLASRGMVAALVAFVLILTQVVSSVSATGSAIIASLTTATSTPTVTPTPTNTSLPTLTSAPTITDTPTLTFTPLATNTPTLTFTPTETRTSLPTPTLRPINTNTPNIPVSGGGSNNSNSNCDPAYPGVCIPPKPPDLDCPQIPYTDFTVLPPDPHGFDRDKDGIGCES